MIAAAGRLTDLETSRRFHEIGPSSGVPIPTHVCEDRVSAGEFAKACQEDIASIARTRPPAARASTGMSIIHPLPFEKPSASFGTA
jgi:hypothetical protein